MRGLFRIESEEGLVKKKRLHARDALNEWITARKAEGLWVTLCNGNCGTWFAQQHVGIRSGRRSTMCGRLVCYLWLRYRRENGRAAPAEMVLFWIEKYGNRLADGGHWNFDKRAAQPRRRAV